MFDFIISSAHAQTAVPAQSPFMSAIPFVLIFLVMYFLIMRPQQKRIKEEQNLLTKLTHGDEVYLKSGILGKITGIADKVVTIEVEGGSRMKVLKSHIGGLASAIFATATPAKK